MGLKIVLGTLPGWFYGAPIGIRDSSTLWAVLLGENFGFFGRFFKTLKLARRWSVGAQNRSGSSSVQEVTPIQFASKLVDLELRSGSSKLKKSQIKNSPLTIPQSRHLSGLRPLGLMNFIHLLNRYSTRWGPVKGCNGPRWHEIGDHFQF